MGNVCGTDLYKQVKQKYQSEFTKFIITRNTIKYLDETVQKSRREIEQKLTEAKSLKIKSIDHAGTEISENYETTKKLLDEKYPGGVKSVQKVKKGKIEDLLGYSYYQQKISDIKLDTSDKFNTLLRQLLLEIQNIHRYHKNKLVQDEPNLVLFNELPPEVQKALYAQGLEEYKEQAQKAKNHLENSFGNKLNAKYHVDKIQNILPQQSLEGLVNLSKEKFQNSLQILTSASSSKNMPKIF